MRNKKKELRQPRFSGPRVALNDPNEWDRLFDRKIGSV